MRVEKPTAIDKNNLVYFATTRGELNTVRSKL